MGIDSEKEAAVLGLRLDYTKFPSSTIGGKA